jgi:biopolymer transport protein ExbD
MRRRLALAPRARRASKEPVVPMINVVFLLLIFFLMTAQIVPPAPFDIDLPGAAGQVDRGQSALYISAEGEIAFNALRGDAALAQAVQRAADDAVRLHADATLSAATLARVLAQLSALGATGVEIVTEGT